VVINELMYEPATVVGTNLVESAEEEFVELYNLSTNSVALYDPNHPTNGWRLGGGISFGFPTGAVLAGQSYALVVGFDPVANPGALGAFRARYGVESNAVIWGPYQGRLSDAGESVALYKPDAPSPAPDEGYVPWIEVDRVNYGVTAPWPEAAAGGGASLQRRVSSEFGNDPLNWKAEPPTAGHTNQPASIAPPVISSQPQTQTVTAGASVTFSMSAAGTWPLSYRWQYNGADLLAATNTSFTISNAQPANSGVYRIWVTNAAGSIYSQPATLSVFLPPVITVQPLSTSVTVDGNATLQVSAAGTKPLAYQWFFNSSPLPAASDASLALVGVGTAAAGTYQVVVTNPVGVAISYPAILRVTGIDSDGDGIPDSWMMQHFGHPTGLASDHSRAQEDADGDGLSNSQEYRVATNPRDPQSCLKLHFQGVGAGAGRPQFAFTAVAGVDYTVQYCDDLRSGLWHKLTDVLADPMTRIVTLADPGAAAAPTRFYRVVSPIQLYLDGDTDGDGIPDSWMIQHFGHPTGLASDRSRAQDDADADGMSNWQEYLAGTDPLDSQSALRLHIQGAVFVPGWPQISFAAMPGVGYTLQYSDDLTSGIWHKLTDVPAEATMRNITLNDFGAASVPVRFFRVVTPIQP
jgi:hypothetical protein